MEVAAIVPTMLGAARGGAEGEDASLWEGDARRASFRGLPIRFMRWNELMRTSSTHPPGSALIWSRMKWSPARFWLEK